MKKILLFLPLLIFLFSCPMPERDNPADRKSGLYKVEVLSVTPEGGTIILGNQGITIRFADPMDRGSLVLSGDLKTADKEWSETEHADDTLTLKPPSGLWPAQGEGKTLVLNCSTSEGIPMAELSLAFDVFYGFFVSSSSNATNPGNDSNSGTVTRPFATVQKGIDEAAGLYVAVHEVAGTVRVAEGTYSSNFRTTGKPAAAMLPGISLYGGYSALFLERDLTQHETILEDTSTTGGDIVEPNRAVDISGLPGGEVLNGFTIKPGASGGHNAGIYCNDSEGFEISANNIIWRGGTDAYGIFSDFSSPEIRDNRIFKILDGSAASTNTTCIYLVGKKDTAPVIENNELWEGKGTDTVIGIDAEEVDSIIKENTLFPESTPLPSNSYAIRVNFVGSPVIENNIIDCGNGNSNAMCVRIAGGATPLINSNTLSYRRFRSLIAYGIFESNEASTPMEVNGNNFDGLFGETGLDQTGYYRDRKGTDTFIVKSLDTSISTFDSELSLAERGNYSDFNSDE